MIIGNKIDRGEYERKVREVKKEDIVKIAKDIKINTIYFLRD